MNTNPPARKPQPPRTSHPNRPDRALVTAPDINTPDVTPAVIDAADDPELAALIAQTGVGVDNDGTLVPVKVWRVAATDHSGQRDCGDGLSPGLAGLLIGLNTRPNDTVVDFDADVVLQGVAGAHGVRYLPITHPAQVADLDRMAAKAALTAMRYPRPASTPAGLAALGDLFTACALVQAPYGCTVVAISPSIGGEPYLTHARQVISAARQVGLGYVEHIVAVTAPIAGERFTNLATPATRPVLRAARASLGHGRLHLDLLVFVLRGAQNA